MGPCLANATADMLLDNVQAAMDLNPLPHEQLVELQAALTSELALALISTHETSRRLTCFHQLADKHLCHASHDC